MQIYILIFLIMCCGTASAQTTAIPDLIFEQKLIDLEIDSDGEINGQVLTSDIENVIELDLSDLYIQDLTGIEDFTALEYLNIEFNQLEEIDLFNNLQLKTLIAGFAFSDSSWPEPNVLDVSANVLLEALYVPNNMFDELDVSNNTMLRFLEFGNSTDDVEPFNSILNMDLSNNPNLEFVSGIAMGMETINLNNGNNNPEMEIIIHGPFGDPPPDVEPVCLQVDDKDAANNNQAPYSEWFIHGPYVFSDNCALSVAEFENIDISIFPNPSSEIVQFQLPVIFQIEKIELFDSVGKLVKQSLKPEKAELNVADLSEGLYFVRIFTNKGVATRKIVVN